MSTINGQTRSSIEKENARTSVRIAGDLLRQESVFCGEENVLKILRGQNTPFGELERELLEIELGYKDNNRLNPAKFGMTRDVTILKTRLRAIRRFRSILRELPVDVNKE